jgi:acetyl-CoA acyltransferase
MSLLLAGLPVEVPGTTINRLCGSGMDAVITAARARSSAGEIELAIAGGVESMSRAPFVMPKADTAFSRNAEIYDTTIGWRFVNPLMKKQYGVDSMPETGENVAEDFNVSRADQDAFALTLSSRPGAAARRTGRLAKEIVPVEIPRRKGDPVVVDSDEHPRETTLEKLAKLPTPVPPGWLVTAGNASGVNDGAAALIVASEAAAAKAWPDADRAHPRRRDRGRPPRIMGIGPAPAAQETVRAARPVAVGFRCRRTERGLCQPGDCRAARTRDRRGRRAHQPQWRRHRARPSARHVRRADYRHGGAGDADPRGEAGACHHVHRRRSGDRHRPRAGLR